MAVVKGSTQYRMRVMPYRPMRRVFNYVLGFLIILGLTIGCYLIGYDHGSRGIELELPGVSVSQNQKHAALVEETTALRKQIANLELNEAINKKASEDIREQLVKQTAQIAAMKRDITVYRGLISSSHNNPQGISIGIFYVDSLEQQNNYHYKLIIQKLLASEEPFDGTLSFRLSGVQKTGDQQKVAEFSLHQLSKQYVSEQIPMTFKYFQNIEGDLSLPAGFTPKKVIVRVKSNSTKHPAEIEKELEWLVTEH